MTNEGIPQDLGYPIRNGKGLRLIDLCQGDSKYDSYY